MSHMTFSGSEYDSLLQSVPVTCLIRENDLEYLTII